jgi:hypothetical protein
MWLRVISRVSLESGCSRTTCPHEPQLLLSVGELGTYVKTVVVVEVETVVITVVSTSNVVVAVT